MSAVRGATALESGLARYQDALGNGLDVEFERWIPTLFEEIAVARRAPVLTAFGSGKRLRGALVCLACDALGGRRDAAIPAAVAIECIHTASLIHDDFVDDDRIRRGRAALWTVDGAREAVLVADVMFASAIDRMVSLDARAGAIVAHAIAEMAAGAYHEFRDLRHDVPRDGGVTYERIVALKTGALFAAAAILGAHAAGAMPALCDRARTFGEHVGHAYQVADDLADLIALDGGTIPPALVHAIRYFAPRREASIVAGLGARREPAALKAVTSGMRAAIARRVDLARGALDAFPDNAYTRMLRELPEAAVGAQVT